jgi:hypothetical protein
MRRTFLSAVVLSALAVAAPGAARAQARLTGFMGVPWGAPADSVLARLGTPVHESADHGMRVLVYAAPAYGDSAMAVVFVHGARGLAGALVSVPIAPDADCRAPYQRLAARVRGDYPGLAEQHVADAAHEADLCAAVRAGEAHVADRWTDAVSGAHAELSYDEGRIALQLTGIELRGGRE